VEKINLLGVEAAANKISLIKRHLTCNGLRPPCEDMKTFLNGVNVAIYEGAVTVDGKDAQFPEVPIADYGGSLIVGTSLRTNHALRAVQGINLKEIASAFSIIDLVHMDLQGYEEELSVGEADFFRTRVRFVAIGTHTRRIEGLLSEFMYDNSFALLREKPCMVRWPGARPENFVNMTYKDGMQVWKNTRL
jgi:hypothetical protein